MAKKKAETTVEEKLRALYNLQLIDTRIDEIRNVRGELPLEVEDLDAEVAGLEKRLSNLGIEVTAYEDEIKAKKNGIETATALINKHKISVHIFSWRSIYYNWCGRNICSLYFK